MFVIKHAACMVLEQNVVLIREIQSLVSYPHSCVTVCLSVCLSACLAFLLKAELSNFVIYLSINKQSDQNTRNYAFPQRPKQLTLKH